MAPFAVQEVKWFMFSAPQIFTVLQPSLCHWFKPLQSAWSVISGCLVLCFQNTCPPLGILSESLGHVELCGDPGHGDAANKSFERLPWSSSKGLSPPIVFDSCSSGL